ncbi:hypothetical protein HNR65_000584 [Desulfosalsimonas propionicica]|jgi:hypothetical protein|uniref:Tox-PAAR-like domain-containing protein n=1 Tax=Desulfosalsimonas propionicica TaxID=332175 RepID=A0A7W0HJK7_9BACT|nr:DUF4150 domain-containing protein [Desulfosalsimonas propionicica]MBA2880277.1 hypothetical protein [Desulfosalsimonas propionicica]
MFANCSMPGMDFAMPDPCKTPTGPVPTPIPYPNMTMKIMGLPPTTNMRNLLTFLPAHNIMSTMPTSMGDTTGVLMGLVSQTIMGPGRNVRCSVKTITQAMPVTRMLDNSLQNQVNAPGGMTLVPGQFKVINLM